MDCDADEEENPDFAAAPAQTISGSAVNSLILDYYKKFGRKRDLEQYFSLSTAQSDVKDTSGTFWRKMKSENDSSDSGGKKSDSSQELCRISIRCSVPDPCSSEYHTKPKPVLTGSALLESLGIHVNPTEQDTKTKSESGSPPIITEEATQNVTHNSDEESLKSYDNNSQKSFDILDTSTNKPLSPTSSITYQRKLEWDSLADVGYANESDRKTSASSLSTLERLALKQQYSNNDTKLDSVLEPPTAHSTPLDENETKAKGKKGVGKKSTKIYKKDVDYLEVNLPHSSENNPPQSINVNLTKHISFNVEKDGKITVDNIQKDVSVSPEKINAEVAASPRMRIDKEMQTSLTKSKDSSAPIQNPSQKIPVLISLNTLRRQTRKKKLRMARKKLKSKKKPGKENTPVQEKSGEPLSEAESFEYMPGHMYNQNKLTANDRSGNTAGNKSSLESSAFVSTDSSKGSKHSFTKDLEKSIDILRAALQRGGDDTNLRKQLIKQVCQRLLKSKYRDDESSSDFLSGLSFSSKKLGLGDINHTTTSTSDNSCEKLKRPKKSILRNDKFNAGAIASTSQSVPNLHTTTNTEKLVSSQLTKNLVTSNTDSDLSHKEKSSSDNAFNKTSSQELYKKYLDALKREDAYRQHLKDKEMFLKQKLVCSDSAIKAATDSDPNINNRLKDLIKDLTRNNYDDGSGDASKLEGGPNSSREYNRFVPIRSQRSHSVFTLSSGGNSDQNKKQNLKKRLQNDLKDLSEPGTSKEHYCCCPYHSSKAKACGIKDSSVQVSLKRSCGDPSCKHRIASPRSKGDSPRSLGKLAADDATGDIKYVCLSSNKAIQDVPDNFVIFKCSRLAKVNQDEIPYNPTCPSGNVTPRKNKNSPHLSSTVMQCSKENTRDKSPVTCGCMLETTTKSSQTNFLLKMLRRRSSDRSPTSTCGSHKFSPKDCAVGNKKTSSVESKIYEATRCLQTEISINPKIPEPALSDINIVTDCAILISENSRTVTKPSLTDVFNRQAQSTETRCNSGSSKSSETSKGIGELFEDESSSKGKTYDVNENVLQGSDSERSEKFTIPIQGTNMTLMVSIGSNERRVQPNVMVGQCVGTEKSKVAEQGTCLTEECSKAVQHDIDLPLSEKSDENSNNVSKIKDQLKNPCTVNVEEPSFNTYPKTSPVNDRKPFRRVNTDTDNFGKCAPLVTFNKKYEDKNKKCSCGCFGSKDSCNDKCSQRVKTNPCTLHPFGQTTSVEKETQCSELSSRECQCGCSGTVDKCNKTCNELTKESETCSSGCGGKPENCKKNCDRSKTTISTQCSGENENSDKNCKERKSCTNKEKILVSPRCSCGCGGSIESCKKNCDERKKGVSDQCSCGCSGDKKNCSINCDNRKTSNSKDIGIQKDFSSSSSPTLEDSTNGRNNSKPPVTKKKTDCNIPSTSKNLSETDSDKVPDKCKSESEICKEPDPILEMIQNITKKYTKKDIEKSKRKKCFKEIMTVLNYLLETEDSSEPTDDKCIISESSTTPVFEKPEKKSPHLPKQTEKLCQKSKSKARITESSDCPQSPQSSDMPGTSSDSATCKVINKIKKECERYHQKRCKIHSGKKCDISSSTSTNCEQCKRVHHCSCRNHKCKGNKKCEKMQKKAVAYNLILQTSESISEDTVSNDQIRQLQNVIVKVPSQRNHCGNVPFKEMCAKIESKMPECSPREPKPCRSKSLPNESEISSMEEFLRKSQVCCTVREYLEQNRPDFIAKSSQRQDCMRILSNSRANVRTAQRDLLSVCLAQLSNVNDLDSDEIRQLAKDLGRHMRQKRPAPKFISERDMKKHSENIYKSLPEVVQKKEEARKENIRKTNLLMAHLFKKNLQTKTLRGSVDISNYSPIIKI